MSPTKHTAAFVGFGQSPIFRTDEVPLGELTAEACRLAIADAGLELSQIDGVCCIPEAPLALEGQTADGTQYVTTEYIINALGIDARWNMNSHGMLSRSAADTIIAVEAGQCDYALLFRSLYSPSGTYGQTTEEEADGRRQFSAPYGIYGTANLGGLPWTRYQDKYRNGTREQMATYIIQERHNGLMYEGGYWTQFRPKELTFEDYMDARLVATPMCIYDCDIPIQGSNAFIVTTADRAKDLRHPPAYVRGVGITSVPPAPGIQNGTLDTLVANAKSIAANLWADSGLTRGDVRVADLYDGFSPLTMIWIEGLGFCGDGEAFDFIQGGRIALDGELPVNPSGGNLGSGRLHGCNQLMDGILQIMGRSGPRQVANADIALVAIGPPGRDSPAFLLGRDPQ